MIINHIINSSLALCKGLDRGVHSFSDLTHGCLGKAQTISQSISGTLQLINLFSWKEVNFKHHVGNMFMPTPLYISGSDFCLHENRNSFTTLNFEPHIQIQLLTTIDIYIYIYMNWISYIYMYIYTCFFLPTQVLNTLQSLHRSMRFS